MARTNNLTTRDAAVGYVETGRNAPLRARGVRTRARLIEAAQRVFERDGYIEARVADIAAAAGVAHGSFYTYFDSKEDVFREMVAGVFEEFHAALEEGDEGSPEARIQTANRRYLELYQRRAPILGVIEQVGALAAFHGLRSELRERNIDRVESMIRTLDSHGEVDIHGLKPNVLARVLAGTLESLAYGWFVLKEPVQEDSALSALDAVWCRSLGLKSLPSRGARTRPRNSGARGA